MCLRPVIGMDVFNSISIDMSFMSGIGNSYWYHLEGNSISMDVFSSISIDMNCQPCISIYICIGIGMNLSLAAVLILLWWCRWNTVLPS